MTPKQAGFSAMSKKWLAVVLKVAVSGLLIWFVTRDIDFGDAGRRMASVDPLMLAVAYAVIAAQMCIGGARWHEVLKAIGAPMAYLKAVQFFFIGTFFNQALPSSVGGDAVRIYKVFRLGLGLRGAINGVFLERVVTVVALVVVVDAIQPWFLPRLDDAAAKVVMSSVAAVTAAAAAGLAVLLALDRLPEGFRRWRVVRGLGNLGADARRVFLSLRHGPMAMAWGLATHVNISFCVYLLAVGLDIDVTWLDCLVLVPPVILAMTLPISIGGWGVRETAMVTVFATVGVPGEAALALSVLFGLVGIAIGIPGGVIWLVSRDKNETLEGAVKGLGDPAAEAASAAPPGDPGGRA